LRTRLLKSFVQKWKVSISLNGKGNTLSRYLMEPVGQLLSKQREDFLKAVDQMLIRGIGANSVVALRRLLWANSGDLQYLKVRVKEMDFMLFIQDIKRMYEALAENKAYYRSIICKGELSKADIF
jgi:hypothetical protein